MAVAAPPESSFVLLGCPTRDKIRLALRDRGYAVRRGDTFPGLGPDFLRVAVRDRATTDAFWRPCPRWWRKQGSLLNAFRSARDPYKRWAGGGAVCG